MEKEYLVISIACNIGFQLTKGLNHCGKDDRETNTPDINHNGRIDKGINCFKEG